MSEPADRDGFSPGNSPSLNSFRIAMTTAQVPGRRYLWWYDEEFSPSLTESNFERQALS